MSKVIRLVFCFVGFCLIFLTILFFCGCNEKAECYFSQTDIFLIKNTDKGTKFVPLVSKNVSPIVSWNEDIIDYDIKTGLILAKSCGSTILTAKYLNEGFYKYETVNVVVEEPCFAEEIEINDTCFLVEGQSSLKIEPKIKSSIGNYNFDITLKSLDENIFNIEDEELFPVVVGEAELEISVVSGYDENLKEYEFLSKKIKVNVLPCLKELKLELLDKNYEKLQKNDEFNLFISNEEKEVFYFAKLTSSVSLKYYDLTTNLDSQVFNILEVEFLEDFLSCILKFKVLKPCEETILFSFSKNDFEITSNEERVHVFRFVTDPDFYVGTVFSFRLSTLDKVKTNELKDLKKDGESFILYSLNGFQSTKNMAHDEKFFYYSVIMFDNLDLDCYNKFSITCESNLLSVKKVSDVLFYVEAKNEGIAWVTFSSCDGGGFETEISFEIKTVEVSSCDFYESQTIFLRLNGEGVDISPKNILPAYASYQIEFDIICYDEVPVEIVGTVLKPKSVGNCFVKVRIGDKSKIYNVLVSSTDYYLYVSESEIHAKTGETATLDFVIYDSSGEPLKNQKPKFVKLFATTEFEYDLSSLSLLVASSDAGVVKFVLKFYDGKGNLLATSENILIVFDK